MPPSIKVSPTTENHPRRKRSIQQKIKSTVMQPPKSLICQMAVQCDITAELTLFLVQVTSDCCQLIRIHTKICEEVDVINCNCLLKKETVVMLCMTMSVMREIAKYPRN